MQKNIESESTRSAKEVRKYDGAVKPDVIAQRKSCSADGVGLSHYILMDRKDK